MSCGERHEAALGSVKTMSNVDDAADGSWGDCTSSEPGITLSSPSSLPMKLQTSLASSAAAGGLIPV